MRRPFSRDLKSRASTGPRSLMHSLVVQAGSCSSIMVVLFGGSISLRYLILSDIHANITAFETVLETAKGKWDKAVCLGDLVGYGPDPNEVIERVRSRDAVTIRGNHDKAVTGLTNPEEFNPVAHAAVLWTRERIQPGNLEYLEKLAKGPIQAGAFSMVHG